MFFFFFAFFSIVYVALDISTRLQEGVVDSGLILFILQLLLLPAASVVCF